MIAEAHQYLAAHSIVRREPLYSANRFARLVSDMPADTVTTAHLQQYRQSCHSNGLKPRTIESSVSDLIAIIHHATGVRLPAGQRLRLTRPEPHPVDASIINAIWPHCVAWLRDWIALTWWTAMRLTDGMDCAARLAGQSLPSVLRVVASKTQRAHAWPVPAWLQTLWTGTAPPWHRSTDFWRKTLRDAISHVCDTAHAARWTPKQLRQRSITEWTRANATAGQLVHGCGIGVLSHYLDPLSVLEAAAPMVRVPACFGATVDTSERLLQCYQRLDSEAQGLVVATAERMVRC